MANTVRQLRSNCKRVLKNSTAGTAGCPRPRDLGPNYCQPHPLLTYARGTISNGGLFFEQGKRNHFGCGAGGIEARPLSGMLASHIAQANAPAKLRRESRAGDVAGFFSGSVSGNEQLRPRHGRLAVEKLQAGKTTVGMPARTDPLHNFLPRIAAFFVIDVGEFQARFVRNIFVVVILPKPCSPEFQTDRIESFHSNGSAS